MASLDALTVEESACGIHETIDINFTDLLKSTLHRKLSSVYSVNFI